MARLKWNKEKVADLKRDIESGLSFSEIVKNSGETEMSCRMAIYRHTFGLRLLRDHNGHEMVIR